MNNQFYSIYDSKAEAYLPPFLERNDMTAIRAVEEAIQDINHPIHKNSADYSLFYLGVWDPETGYISHEPNGPKHITDCWVIKARYVNDQATSTNN